MIRLFHLLCTRCLLTKNQKYVFGFFVVVVVVLLFSFIWIVCYYYYNHASCLIVFVDIFSFFFAPYLFLALLTQNYWRSLSLLFDATVFTIVISQSNFTNVFLFVALIVGRKINIKQVLLSLYLCITSFLQYIKYRGYFHFWQYCQLII